MNVYLNYLLEASIGLCLFLLVYQLVLRKETNFRLNRIFLLIAIIASVTFPLLKFNTVDSPVPSLNFSVETSEANVTNYEPIGESIEASTPSFSTWEILTMLYAAGLVCFFVVFVVRVFGMIKVLKKSPKYKYNDHNIIELKSKDSPFSFFNYIFIGNNPPISESEKQQIIKHESIHARLYHSFDIVLLNVLGIVFWFNPLIRIYKKIFVQLHEFEADARAVENNDVNEYCSLLARVALHSADYKLANHFSNSLTLKRIEMMRTLKHKLKSWKVVAVAACLPILFFVVSCQDQAETPQYTEVDGRQSSALTLTKNVQQTLDKLKAEHPDDEFILIGPNGHDPKDFEGEHAKHISTIDGNFVFEAEKITAVEEGKDKSGKVLRYLILQYTNKQKNTLPSDASSNNNSTINGEPIYYAVEKMAEAPGGILALQSRLIKQIQYPEVAKRAGLQGSVYVKFIVTKEGKLNNFEIIKSISKELDEEAIRAMKTEQNWKPGMQNGKTVHSQFVMPVKFMLAK